METFNHKVKRLINQYIRLAGTRDPAEIARSLGIRIAIVPLGNIAGITNCLIENAGYLLTKIFHQTVLFRNSNCARIGTCCFSPKRELCIYKNRTLLLTVELKGKQTYSPPIF